MKRAEENGGTKLKKLGEKTPTEYPTVGEKERENNKNKFGAKKT